MTLVPGKKGRTPHTRALIALLPKGSVIARGQESPTKDGKTPGRARGAHLYVFLPDGDVLREENGMPVMVATTPGDKRSLMNAKAQIRRALREKEERDASHVPSEDTAVHR